MTGSLPAGDQPAGGAADAEAIRAATLAAPDVAGLSAGAFGEVASYFSGRRVPGVRVDDDTVEVHIVAAYGTPLRQVADNLGSVLHPLLAGRELRVVVSDVLLPGETLEGPDGAENG